MQLRATEDPTFYAAWSDIRKEERREERKKLHRALKHIKDIAKEYDFEIIQPIVLRAVSSGRVYNGRNIKH